MSELPAFLNTDSSIHVIAEIGINHNGSLQMAFKLIEEAKACGAHSVKFQSYRSDLLASDCTPKVKYQLNTQLDSESHQDMLKKYELSLSDHISLQKCCSRNNILFTSTPYDPMSAEMLNKLQVPYIKVASADIIDFELHSSILSTGLPLVLSTGMATIDEISAALRFYDSTTDICLLHCVSNYPCSDSSLNLSCIPSLEKAFGIHVGFSDHSNGSEAAICAFVQGSRVFERHFTLDKSLEGPDHKASSDIQDLGRYILSLQRVTKMLGSPQKLVQKEELEMRSISRKSAHWNVSLKKNTPFSRSHFSMRRPATGISFTQSQTLLNFVITRDVYAGDPILLSDFK